MANSSPFEFVEEPLFVPVARGAAQRVVRIPRSATRKRQLLETLSRTLQFPEYFGWNWDALDECLRDLSWLTDAKEIVLLHEAVPLSHAASRTTYLQILRDLSDANSGEGPRFRIVFPAAERDLIEQSLQQE